MRIILPGFIGGLDPADVTFLDTSEEKSDELLDRLGKNLQTTADDRLIDIDEVVLRWRPGVEWRFSLYFGQKFSMQN